MAETLPEAIAEFYREAVRLNGPIAPQTTLGELVERHPPLKTLVAMPVRCGRGHVSTLETLTYAAGEAGIEFECRCGSRELVMVEVGHG